MQYAPFKPGHKGTLAERAKALGLETLASDYLNKPNQVDLKKYINHSVKGMTRITNIIYVVIYFKLEYF